MSSIGAPLLPSWLPRTVPTKLQTAPTRWSLIRMAAISSARLKSAVCMETRSAIPSASRDGGKESDFAAFAQRRGFVAHHLVQRQAHRLAAREPLRMGTAARDQLVAQGGQSRCRGLHDFAAVSHRFAHRREIPHRELHASNSAKEM